MNIVVLIGRVARAPELRFIPYTGMAVAKFTLAVDKEMSKDKKQELTSQGKQTADFISITVFGKQAENCANYLAKGSQCAVHGRISTGSYTTQTGEKRYTTDIIADRVEFIGAKGQATSSQQGRSVQPDSSFFDEFPDEDNDIFQPVDDEDIPF
ncbi:MAG: single-stranded DNA-binding protein [Sedimentibacter sp.]|uniref:single-stranded DNA-binding protein n=1 Tax=Sedimentibacter sp. TaxID=1960295 RepID=UPI00298209B7|nr:single-stranded DNA-binding protein [Sedimentibacter sp.]MDW5300608.1 single-stranded DNA-binding protein [Sedimentibacter sp.]